MDILLGCECTGAVRRLLRDAGFNAWSCDILPAEDSQKHHIKADVRSVLSKGWDAAIFFTPCTYLSNSGVRWLYEKPGRWDLMRRDAELFRDCMNSNIPRVANENPIPHKYALEIIGKKYDQIIQPWQFGHGETKATCLWLNSFPKLIPTQIVSGRKAKIHLMPPGPNRSYERSRTYAGIAGAFCNQWFVNKEN